MKARELFNRRVPVTEQAFAELVLWEVPEPLSGSKHRYKSGWRSWLRENVCCAMTTNPARATICICAVKK